MDVTSALGRGDSVAAQVKWRVVIWCCSDPTGQRLRFIRWLDRDLHRSKVADTNDGFCNADAACAKQS